MHPIWWFLLFGSGGSTAVTAPSRYALIQKPSDNAAKRATWTIQTGTDPGDSHYGPAVLIDDNPAKVAKILSTTGAWVGDFGTPTRVENLSLVHHNFDAGAVVLAQFNNTNVWTAPAFQVAVTIPDWLGEEDTRWPVNPFVDLTLATGWRSGGWRYMRLSVVANSQTLELGQLWLGGTNRWVAPKMLDQGPVLTFDRPVVELVSAYGVSTFYELGTVILDTLDVGGALSLSAADTALLEAVFHGAAGRSRPWLFALAGTENQAFLVRRKSTTFQRQRRFDGAYWRVPLVIEEVGRGLRPGV